MKVVWLGMNDEGGCVLGWHELREHLRDEYGVILVGPGYGTNVLMDLQAIADSFRPDWIVLDDCNAKGYVPLQIPSRPKNVRIAWREHDWHNGYRKQTAYKLQPDLIMGCVERRKVEVDKDPFRHHKAWVLVPHPINTRRFTYGVGERDYGVGLYGKTGACYGDRTKAKRVIAERGSGWLPLHGGYWHNGKPHNDGIRTFYNDKLAKALRNVKCLWVDGSDYNVFLAKYLEGAASGCLLIGKKPFAWTSYFPEDGMVECQPDDINRIVDFYIQNERARLIITRRMREYVEEHHSIEVRAKEIIDLLEGSR